jgi:uncharacterized protein
MHRIGVISDTHGLLRPQALAALAGSELIIHAGDVGRPEILDELRAVAPVVAVRGNVDYGQWALALPLSQVVEVGETQLYVLHDRNALDLNPVTAGFKAVISGHTHKPLAERTNGVLYLNPGSAGPRRFKLPVTLAVLETRGGELDVQFVELDVAVP